MISTETPRRITPARRRPAPLSVSLGFAALLVVWTSPGLTAAQDDPPSSDACAELRTAIEGLEAEPTSYALNGAAGLWFPTPIARLMLCEVRALRLHREELRLHREELRLWEQRVSFTERQRDLAVQARDALEGIVETANRRAREAESSRDAWWRSPILWAVLGAVVGGGLVIGGAYVAGAVP